MIQLIIHVRMLPTTELGSRSFILIAKRVERQSLLLCILGCRDRDQMLTLLNAISPIPTVPV